MNGLFRLGDFITPFKIYIKSGSLYLFSSLFTGLIGIVINPYLAKNLSPEDYAIIGYFSSFNLIILPLINFSLISYYLRNYYIIKEDRREIVSDTILICLIFYGVIALFLVFIAFYFYWKFNNVSFPFFPYALITFAPIYFNNFILLFQVQCRLTSQAKKYAKLAIFNASLNALFAIFLVVIFKFGATGRLIATLLASIIVGYFCFHRMLVKMQFDWTVVKDALKFGWPLSISAILWYFLSGVDRAILEKLGDTYTFGFYNVAIQMSGYLLVFYNVIAQTFEPDIYKAIAENKKRRLIKIIASIFSLNALPNVIFIIFAPFIIGLLTYNRYTDSSDFARILALKNIVLALYYAIIAIVIGYGYTKSHLIIMVLGSISSFFIYKILITHYSFLGAAWGQVLAIFVLVAIVFLFLLIKLKISENGNSWKNKRSMVHNKVGI